MDITRTPAPFAAPPRRFLSPDFRREAVSLFRDAVIHLVGVTLLLALLILGYATKRALGLDLVPGIDMLPDPEIEAALEALVSLLGG